MLPLLFKYRHLCLLTLCVILGLACSQLAGVLLGAAWQRRIPPPLAAPRSPSAPQPADAELGFILQHHLFDRTARGTTALSFSPQGSEAGAAATTQGDLDLVGTVVAGSRSLATIRTPQGLQIYQLGAEIPGGKIEAILRHEVSIRNQNGTLTVLRMYPEGTATGAHQAIAPTATAQPASRAVGGKTTAARTSSGAKASDASPADPMAVRTAGNNRWIVSRGTAEAARENIGAQLRTAQLQPNLADGRTDGFVISRIQAGTLLAHMGLQRGDVIKRVNRMPLESPEKALQIMQQLREARQITIDLERGGAPLSFTYEIE